MIANAPVYAPLTVPITKHLACGHERTDGAASRLGESMHCVDCRRLRDVERISLPLGVRLSAIDRSRLCVDAGYRLADVDAIEQLASR